MGTMKIMPYLLIIIGILLLLFLDLPIPAGACVLIGLVMIFDKIWPEKWGANM